MHKLKNILILNLIFILSCSSNNPYMINHIIRNRHILTCVDENSNIIFNRTIRKINYTYTENGIRYITYTSINGQIMHTFGNYCLSESLENNL